MISSISIPIKGNDTIFVSINLCIKSKKANAVPPPTEPDKTKPFVNSSTPYPSFKSTNSSIGYNLR
jgi:hypothetical protein